MSTDHAAAAVVYLAVVAEVGGDTVFLVEGDSGCRGKGDAMICHAYNSHKLNMVLADAVSKKFSKFCNLCVGAEVFAVNIVIAFVTCPQCKFTDA